MTAWRRVGALKVLIAAAAAIAGIGIVRHSASAPVPTPAPDRAARGRPDAHPQARDRATAAITAGMTPLQLAGERIVYSYSGLTPPASLLTAIRAGEAAGVILFSDNISSAAQVRGVARQLQAAALASPQHAPLLLMTDQEGGEVRRLPGGPTLSEKQIGESAQASTAARAAGSSAAAALTRAGINLNLAPVLDVYRQPGDFDDQYQRSYSDSASTVATLGSAFIAGEQPPGIAATAKHFPGLGAASASQNTDAEPVQLNLSLSQIRAVDEAPFRSAITAGVKLIMSSWATYPALDPTRPAGLSAAVVQGELRQRLGFQGVTITDALGAGALDAYGSTGNRALLAALAGQDLILCSEAASANTPQQGLDALYALAKAIRSKRLDPTAAAQAAAAVLQLRHALSARV